MKNSVCFLVVFLASLTIMAHGDVRPVFAYGGGSGVGMVDPQGSSAVNISFTGDLASANSNVATAPPTVKPLKFDRTLNRNIRFWHGMLMWSEIFDQSMSFLTFLPTFVGQPIGLAYHGPKNITRFIFYGEDRTIQLNEGLASDPNAPNVSGWVANTFVLKPVRDLRKGVFEAKPVDPNRPMDPNQILRFRGVK